LARSGKAELAFWGVGGIEAEVPSKAALDGILQAPLDGQPPHPHFNRKKRSALFGIGNVKH
jgi:hypothetical protein